MALTKVGSGGIENVTNAANATFLTIDASEQITVASEGGAVTTSVQQGLIKGFVTYDGTTTPSARDSLNHSSITDNANADHTLTHTNNYNNATNYFALGTGGYTSDGQAGGHLGFDRISSNGNEAAPTTSARRISHQKTTTIDEQKYASVAFGGDLA